MSLRKVPKGELSFFEADDMDALKGKGLKRLRALRKKIKEYDQVIWYSFIVPHRYALFLSLHPLIQKKSTWIVWGMDLHNWKVSGKSLSSTVKNIVHAIARKRFNTVICLEDDDKAKYQSDFGKKATCIRANLPMNKDSLCELEGMKRAERRSNGRTFIQIEHNAHSFNNHLKIIDSLKSVDSDSFEYYLPLAYGTKKDWGGNPEGYRDLVADTSFDAFGERSHPLFSMMPIENYNRFLWNMDIAIFGSSRQNGLGNALRLLYVGNKVFLPKENPTYKRLASMGLPVFATEDISGMSREEFLRPPDRESVELVGDWVMRSYYPDNLVHMWKHVFAVIEGRESEKDYEAIAHKGGFFVARPEPSLDVPVRKESILNMKPYIWPNKHRISCGYSYIVGGDRTAYALINPVMHMSSGLYLKGIVGLDDEIKDDVLNDFCVGSLLHHFPFGDNDRFIVAELAPLKRKRIWQALEADGACLEPLIASTALTGYKVDIGDGSAIAPYSSIGSGSTVGKGVWIGMNSHVGSNCKIGDWSVIGDNVVIADNTVIEPGTFLESGSKISSTNCVC